MRDRAIAQSRYWGKKEEGHSVSVDRSPQNPADNRVVAPKGHGAKTEAVRERAVAALLGERSIARAAKRSGVNEGTLRRWLAEDEAFKTAYVTARRATFQDAMDRIQVVTARAVETLEDLLSAKKNPSV